MFRDPKNEELAIPNDANNEPDEVEEEEEEEEQPVNWNPNGLIDDPTEFDWDEGEDDADP